MKSADGNDMPAEINFSRGARGLHHIPPDAKVLMPASIERGVWEYFSGKAEERGVEVSDLVTEVLKRDIGINEALRYGSLTVFVVSSKSVRVRSAVPPVRRHRCPCRHRDLDGPVESAPRLS